ncbi:MAG: hypothetical protein ACI9EK_001706 [Psychroserpens sp.]|jgi:hypothetical protein
MKNKIGIYIHKPGTIGNLIFNVMKFIANKIQFNALTDQLFTRKTHRNIFGRSLNLKTPKSFNEKIQWLKLYDQSLLKTKCADKYAVRIFVINTIGEKYLIPLHLTSENPDDISTKNLPDLPVIVKTNHASGQVFIIKDKMKTDFMPIQQSLRYQLRRNFYHAHREWQYKYIKPCILVETLLQDDNSQIPKDYKLHCFHGRPLYIQVDSERFSKHKRCIYDRDWQYLDIEYNKPKGDVEPPPIMLVKMFELAVKLSSAFIYVRVDFYQVNNKIFFGELTFTPEAGRGKFDSYETDLAWGKHIHLPLKN